LETDILGGGVDDLYIGAASHQAPSNIGALDDFRIYTYALASDEVRALANAPLPALTLDVSRAGNSLTLRWPIVDNTQFRVESASALGSSAVWTPLGSVIQTTEHYQFITEPLTPSTRFFRLRKL
jgi:hypothetical protein